MGNVIMTVFFYTYGAHIERTQTGGNTYPNIQEK
jgi:hypothetical protein